MPLRTELPAAIVLIRMPSGTQKSRAVCRTRLFDLWCTLFCKQKWRPRQGLNCINNFLIYMEYVFV